MNRPAPPPGTDVEPKSLGDWLTERQRKRHRTGDTLLGRYRILGELGRGGMGLVYRCLDEVGGIEVAVKMLPPEVARDSGEMEEVRDNFGLVSRLAHPSIATARTLGRDTESGEYFLIMDLASGESLRACRKRKGGRLALDEVVAIVRQIAEAIDHAHTQKVIHRDIKPSNVMIAPDGSVKVLDFGLAAQVQSSFSRVSQARFGTSGTGPYMAPEQWRGQYQDGRTDQYALAVLTYELLAGRPPFDSRETGVLKQAVLNEPPERPAGLPDVPWAALRRALGKKREERFASCGEFAEALRTGKISSQAAPAPAGKSTTASKGKGMKVLAAAVVLAAIAWVGWGIGRKPVDSNLTADRRGSWTNQVAMAEQAIPDPQSPWENSLGMKFVPVPGTEALFCIWETRVRDFATFVRETGHDATNDMHSLREDGWKQRGDAWKSPGFAQAEDHPVCGVNWEDAKAFCAWLTGQERRLGRISSDQSYRLPADWEWSVAVGLSEAKGGSPKDKDAKTPDVYPWGTQWPPPSGAGNYAGEESKAGAPSDWNFIPGYSDGFARTAPVGSFDASNLGLHNMGGNVWEWCEDWYDSEQKYRVMRGGSWSFNLPEPLLSSYRYYVPPRYRSDCYGFRVVLSSSSRDPASAGDMEQPAVALRDDRKAGGIRTGPVSGPDRTSPETGMEFVWVPALKIWVGKYEVTNGEYRKKVPGHDSKDFSGKTLNGDRQPVVYVNFDDAKAFAEWMTQRDRAAGALPADCRYRLPSEQEWQAFAQCGDGRRYPWGGSMPPRHGNYCGQETRGIAGSMIEGYDDGFPVTCPVERSGKNDWGLYGVGGNVWEATASDNSGGSVGAWRGASWDYFIPGLLSCGFRGGGSCWDRSPYYGFRLVLAR